MIMLKIIPAIIVGIFFGCAAFFAVSLISGENIETANNRDYFQAAYSSVKNAKSSIHISMFTMKFYPENKNSKENMLLDALIEAKQRGVKVKIVIEGGDEFLGDEYTMEQKEACDYLAANGVEVRFDAPGRTTHTKLVIVDDIVLIGSTNWNYYALEHNNEANVLIKSSKIAREYEKYFDKIWQESILCSFNITADCTSINSTLSNRMACDGKVSFINGTASGLELKTSQKGNNYTTFNIGKISIFAWGHLNMTEGQWIFVKGIYSKEKQVGGYTFENEIEATEIEVLSP